MVFAVPPMRRDPLIIGAGPAGSAAAVTLGRAGGRPLLIERAAGPIDKVCGDFLSIDTVQHACVIGVDPVRLGAAPIYCLRVTKDARTVEAILPFPAFGLSRRALDAALLRCAEAAGAIVQLGQTVRNLTYHANQWTARTDQALIKAETVFLATGKHDLRDLPRPQVSGGAIGMKMYLKLTSDSTRMLHDAIELTLFPGGYAGLQCVEDGRVVLCIAVRKPSFQRYGSSWTGMVTEIAQRCKRFATIMAGAHPLLPRPLAVAGVPYGYQAAAPSMCGLFRLGDQAVVIPSLTGDGLAIALYSGQQAAEAWLSGRNSASYHCSLARTVVPQMRLAGLLHGVGLVGPTQTAAIHILGLFPGLLQQAARHTRLKRGWTMPCKSTLTGAKQSGIPDR